MINQPIDHDLHGSLEEGPIPAEASPAKEGQTAGGITLDHAYLLVEPAYPIATAPSSPSPSVVETGNTGDTHTPLSRGDLGAANLYTAHAGTALHLSTEVTVTVA